MRLITAFFTTMMLMPAATWAADGPEPARYITPFVDGQTLVVAHVDVTRIDLNAVFERLTALTKKIEDADKADLGEFTEQLEARKQMTTEWKSRFTNAGGRDLYFTFSLIDILPPSPPLIIAPLSSGANGDAIGALLSKNKADGSPREQTDGPDPLLNVGVCAEINDAMVAGTAAQIERLRAIVPAQRPELQAAFKAVSETAGQLALIPPADSRRVFAEMLPTTLPADLGGGPTSTISQGLTWVALGVNSLPDPSLKLVIQAADTQNAQALQTLANNTIAMLQEIASLREAVPKLDRIADLVKPTLEQNRLITTVGPSQLNPLIDDLLLPLIAKTHQDSQLAAIAGQVRDVAKAIHLYRAGYKDEWPDDLEVLVEKKYLKPEQLVNPRRPDLPVGFVYLKPGKSEDPRQVMLYEKHDTWPKGGLAVGFLDGHVESINNQQKFKDLMEETAARKEEAR